MFLNRRALLPGLIAVLFAAGTHAENDPLETVEVTASREQMRREIQTFVHKVTRLEGEFVGRWGMAICPMVVGVSDEQAQFIQNRLIDVQDEVRKGNLSFGHARALLAHPDPEAMAGVVRARGLTVRQTEGLASRGGAGKARSGDRPQTADSAALEQRLVERLGFHARVTTGRQGRVSVVLDFADVYQLEEWVAGLT